MLTNMRESTPRQRMEHRILWSLVELLSICQYGSFESAKNFHVAGIALPRGSLQRTYCTDMYMYKLDKRPGAMKK